MSPAPHIISAASEYVRSLMSEKLPAWCVYHSYDHTTEVVDASREIGRGARLTKSEIEIVTLAAWFHDTGYTETVEGHEQVSSRIAREFLMDHALPEEKVEQVTSAILATGVSARPANRYEMVLKDADILHTGRKGFETKSRLLRLEEERRNGRVYSDLEWLNINLEFVARSRFHTDFARSEYGRRRERNLLALQKQIAEAERGESAAEEQTRGQTEKQALKKERSLRPDRGIETMFRTVPTHHLTLSSIADNKANLMLSTNALIVSIVFGLLISKLDTNPHLMIPTFLLLGVCLTAIVFAILATRPKVTRGTFTRDDINRRKVNLLFFGNFHSVSMEDFEWGMKEMMNDREYLYGSMIKDLYNLGQVLERKYRYLRICYNVFMYGLIVSVLAFLMSFLTMPGIAD